MSSAQISPNIAEVSIQSRVLPIGRLPQDERLRPLKNLDGYFPFVPPETREAWQNRAAEVRRQVLVAAGLWPMPEKTPLNAVIHGRIDRDSYTIEKVFFESCPGHFVTGNLYRPKNRSGKCAAVLTPHGHWPEGRFHDMGPVEIRKQIADGAERFERSGRHPLQARCVQLARMGCVVFHYDMVGYADSRQLVHCDKERPELAQRDSWLLHTVQAEARLQTIFGLQSYNSVRALDFLCSLPDVDPQRIGITGASGGGTQTMILCAIDPRPAAAVPAVMISTAMQGGCKCENGSYLRIGSGNIELTALFAPKPVGMTGADDWTIEIGIKGLPELKQLYRLFDAEDRVSARTLAHFPHNYNYVSRAFMYAWFNKHLYLGFEEPIVEEDFQPLSREEMSVWDQSHPSPQGGPDHERKLVAQMTENARRQLQALAPKDAASLKEYRRVVGGAIETIIGRRMPAPEQLDTGNVTFDILGPYKVSRFMLRYAAKGEEIPVARLNPKNWNRKIIVWIDPRGKQSLWNDSGDLRAAVRTLLDCGYIVIGADLMGQGEFTSDGNPLSQARINPTVGSESDDLSRYAPFTFCYNPPLFAQRVHDVMSLVAYARGLNAESVEIVGLAGAGHIVAAARAICGSAILRAAIDTTGFRFANVAAIDDPDFLPGGAKYDDLPGLLALSAPHPLCVIGETQSAMSLPAGAYRASQQSGNLVVKEGLNNDADLAMIQWIVDGKL